MPVGEWQSISSRWQYVAWLSHQGHGCLREDGQVRLAVDAEEEGLGVMGSGRVEVFLRLFGVFFIRLCPIWTRCPSAPLLGMHSLSCGVW